MIKKFFSKTKKFSIKTICVGNIYIGGTGKTPLCIDLLKEFKEELKNNALEAVIIKKDYKDQIDEIDLIKRSTGSIIVEKKARKKPDSEFNAWRGHSHHNKAHVWH